VKLGHWIISEKINFSVLAQRTGCKPDTTRRHCLPIGDPDHRLPRIDMMQQYYLLTNGAVTPNDFYDLPDLPAVPAGKQAADG